MRNFILIMMVTLLTACAQTGPNQTKTDHGEGSNACSQDAMQCPDGTWVGRSGPKCEFVCSGFEPK